MKRPKQKNKQILQHSLEINRKKIGEIWETQKITKQGQAV